MYTHPHEAEGRYSYRRTRDEIRAGKPEEAFKGPIYVDPATGRGYEAYPEAQVLELLRVVRLAVAECPALQERDRLADRDRRSLLLAWLPDTVRHALPYHSSPADQLRSDVQTLAEWSDENGAPPLIVWLENAERLTDYLPVSKQFAAWRRTIIGRGGVGR